MSAENAVHAGIVLTRVSTLPPPQIVRGQRRACADAATGKPHLIPLLEVIPLLEEGPGWSTGDVAGPELSATSHERAVLLEMALLWSRLAEQAASNEHIADVLTD